MTDRRLQDTMARAEAAWRDRWESEAPSAPPRRFHYTVEFECTHETWDSVRLALASFPLSNKHASMREIGKGVS